MNRPFHITRIGEFRVAYHQHPCGTLVIALFLKAVHGVAHIRVSPDGDVSTYGAFGRPIPADARPVLAALLA